MRYIFLLHQHLVLEAEWENHFENDKCNSCWHVFEPAWQSCCGEGKHVTPMNTNTSIWKQKGKDRVVYAANMQVKRNADQWRARTALWRMLVVRVAVIFHGARLYETCEAWRRISWCQALFMFDIWKCTYVIMCFCIHCVCLFVCLHTEHAKIF